MNTLLTCNCFWVEVFPNLWWGLVVGVIVLGALGIVRTLIKSYINSKIDLLDKQQSYEKQMKDDAFDREKEWYFIKRIENLTDEDINKFMKELEELRKKEKDLNNGTESLNKEKEQFEKKILNHKIKVYEEIIKKINK
jgi:hypothetical protein